MPRHDFLRALARLCLLAGLGLAAAAAAEPPTLFKDLAPGTAEDEGSSPGVPTPFEGPFPVVDESVFFLVRGAGSVLWTSDGTAEGTRRLRAVCVETSCTLEASNTATANGLLFFIGQDEVHGHEVWVSDGTPDGTLLPRDVSANAFASPPRRLTAAGDVVYFSVESVRGFDRDLWKSDGSAVGTELVLVGAVPEDLIADGELLYFANGDYLWQSDGTPGGTAPVTMRRFSRLDVLAVIDGHVFFDAGLDPENALAHMMLGSLFAMAGEGEAAHVGRDARVELLAVGAPPQVAQDLDDMTGVLLGGPLRQAAQDPVARGRVEVATLPDRDVGTGEQVEQ